MNAFDAVQQQQKFAKVGFETESLLVVSDGSATHFIEFIDCKIIDNKVYLAGKLIRSEKPEPKKRAPRKSAHVPAEPIRPGKK